MKILERVFLSGLFVLFIVVQLFKNNVAWSNFYNKYLYRGISLLQRFLFGELKFNVGEIVIILIFVALCFWLVFLVVSLTKYKYLDLCRSISLGISVLNISLFFYVLYMFLWGLNYNRPPVKYFNNEVSSNVRLEYDIEELNALGSTLLDTIRYTYQAVDSAKFEDLAAMYQTAFNPYKKHLVYKSVKSSMFSKTLSYLGISGYYNFLSGEAVINTNYPDFLRPFVISHEISHQKGIAAEGLANFEGFISAMATRRPEFIYSASLTAFMYTIKYISRENSDHAEALVKELPDAVLGDLKTYREYTYKYSGALNAFTSKFYDWFLRNNNQRNGLRSYDEFINMLILWNKHTQSE